MRTTDLSDKIPGLMLVEEVVDLEEEEKLVKAVDQRPWTGLGHGPNPELKRRTQQYGHLFSYRYRKVMEEYGPLPDFATGFVDCIMENKWMPFKPNHLLVNEYNPGQGIMPHIDAPALFGPAILSLSLLSDCIMKFTCDEETIDVILRKYNAHVKAQQYLSTNCINTIARRSLVILTGDARYKYKHGISKDLTESTDAGETVYRDRRVSFTFREIIAWEDKKCVPNSK